ncbi:MAG: DUF998 domain-containing protein [Thermoplasmata archaeon]
MKRIQIVRASVVVVIAGYLFTIFGIGIAIACSPWFSFFYNWLSDLGNSKMGTNYVFDGLKVCVLFNLSLMVGGISGIIFSIGLSISGVFNNRKGKTGVGILLTGMIFIFLTGLFSEDFGVVHSLVSSVFFFAVPVSLLVFSFSLRGYNRIIFTVTGIISLIAFVLLFVDRPWGSNSVIEFIPAVALGIEVLTFSRLLWFSSENSVVTPQHSQFRESS